MSLSEGRERSWSIRRPSVRFEDVDDLSSFGGTDGPSFDFIVVAQFGVEFQQVFGYTGVQAMEEDVNCFLIVEGIPSDACEGFELGYVVVDFRILHFEFR